MDGKFIVLSSFALIMISCAGPMNPFGASNMNLSPKASLELIIPEKIREIASTVKANITFFPARQNWHSSSDFTINIDDERGVPENFQLDLYYNGVNVTDQLLSHARIEREVTDRRVSILFKDLRLLPARDNDIVVVYLGRESDQQIRMTYQAPTCSLGDNDLIKDFANFKRRSTLVKKVGDVALDEGVNPSFIAGLIAQESGFNPRAVSWAKAIGLTQVTPLAEKQILNSSKGWPQYRRLNRYSVPRIKTLIQLGKVNRENEWRLDEELSVRGGIEYLRFISKYWQRGTQQRWIKKYYQSPEEIIDELILASYNSGPARVKYALRSKGQKWLRVRKLKEARKYVGKVKSYCYDFATKD